MWLNYFKLWFSYYATGGILYQWNGDGKDKVIVGIKRSLKGTEQNYFILEKEICYVYCVNKIRYYLVGQDFKILSDNQALSFLLKCKLSYSDMSQMIMAMQECDFAIKYCNASDNKMADTLSCCQPVEQERLFW